MIDNLTPQYFLDLIQSYKANLVNKYVTDPRISRTLESAIQAETTFLTNQLKTFSELSTYVFDDSLTCINKKIKSIF